MATPKRFTAKTAALAGRINRGKLLRAAALLILTNVSGSTPVDTGRARSNWLTAIGTPRRDTEGPGGGSVDKGRGTIAAAKGGDTIFISNNLPYINSLNAGSSMQAPAEFIQAAIDSAGKSLATLEILKE